MSSGTTRAASTTPIHRKKESLVYVIRHRQKLLSYADVASDHTVRRYIIGVPSKHLATRIQSALGGDEPSVRLYSSWTGNKLVRRMLGLLASPSGVIIDPCACLHIPKAQEGESAEWTGADDRNGGPRRQEQNQYTLELMTLRDFARSPLDPLNDVDGVVMPFDVLADSASEIVLISNIVESNAFESTP